jgi:hypothetical protein
VAEPQHRANDETGEQVAPVKLEDHTLQIHNHTGRTRGKHLIGARAGLSEAVPGEWQPDRRLGRARILR